jgi:hypothetical protein
MNGTVLAEPLLDVNAGNVGESGMLGNAIAAKNENGDRNGTTSLSILVRFIFSP